MYIQQERNVVSEQRYLESEWDDNLSVLLRKCNNSIQFEENGDNKTILFAIKKFMSRFDYVSIFNCSEIIVVTKNS
jgi:hypothetical protein